MRTSTQINELAASLSKAQGEFPPIVNAQVAEIEMKNGGTYVYTYADLSDVLKAVRPVLAANSLAIMQFQEYEDVRGSDHLDWLRTRLLHSSGQWIETVVALEVDRKDAKGVMGAIDPQAMGSAITYARRYCLSAMLGIATEDDDDGAAAKNRTRRSGKGNSKKASPNQVSFLERLSREIDGIPDIPAWAEARGIVDRVEREPELLGVGEASALIDALIAYRDGTDAGPLSEEAAQASQRGPETHGETSEGSSTPTGSTGSTSSKEATVRQLGAVDALLKKHDLLGSASTYLSGVLGRTITSPSDLTKSDASKVLDALNEYHPPAPSADDDIPF